MNIQSDRKRYLLWITGILIVAGVAFFLGRRSVGPSPVEGVTGRTEAAHGEEGHAKEAGSAEGQAADSHGDETRGEKGLVKFEGKSLQLAHLRVEPIGYRALRSRLAVTGTVEPNLGGVVKITPRVAGKITSIRVSVGDNVRSGQPLAALASLELAQAQAAFRQAASRVAVTEINLRRQRRLAALGEFARPRVEEARRADVAARGEASTAHGEVAAVAAEVTEAQSQLRALQAALVQAQTQVQVTASRFHRADLLLKDELVSRQDWEQAQADDQRAQADVDVARANIAAGQAKVQTGKAHLEAAEARLAEVQKRRSIAARALAREEAVYQGRYMTSKEIVEAEAAWRQAQAEQRAAADSIRLYGGISGGGSVLIVTAPLGGRVTERLVTLGETVTPEKPLFTVMNLHTVWVQLNVYPKDVPAVRAGQAVTVNSDTAPGYTFSGTVSYISDVVDPATRTVRVRCAIRNRRDLLKPGAFVRGNIGAGGRTPAFVVPKDAVQQMGGRSVVFMPAGKPDEFRAHPVEVGQSFGSLVEIPSGLKPGDRIVTRNAFLVKAQAMKSELGEEDEEKGKE